MPRPAKGPRLGGGPAHEKKILANLASSLILHKKIQTTEHKAKRLSPYADRLVTFAKRGDLHSRRRALALIGNKEAVHILFTEIAPQVEDREGGYTRIVKLGNRKGDNAPIALIELVLEPVVKKAKAKPAAKKEAVVEEAPAEVEETVETPEEEEAPAEEAEAAAAEVTEAAETAEDASEEAPEAAEEEEGKTAEADA